MKIKGLLLSFVCALALSVGLLGCGGTAPAEDYTANFSGPWSLYAIDAAENPSSPDDIAMMRTLGLVCTLTLSEEGNATLDLFGDTTEGTWEATSAEAATVTIQDQAIGITLADDKLYFEQAGDTRLVFERGLAPSPVSDAPQAAPAESSDTAADAAAEGDAATEEAPAEGDAATEDAAAEEAPAEGEAEAEE